MIYQKPQLFILHFAGGSSHSFRFLKDKISTAYEVHALELPGRGKRFKQELIKNNTEAIEDYVSQIQAKRNRKPFVIYGHSMGAVLGLFVAKRLENTIDFPEALITTGNPGLGVRNEDDDKKGKRYLLNDEDFKQELRELGGVTEEALENKELFNFFSPLIRADFEVVEQGFKNKNIVIKTPIHAVMGSEEKCSNRLVNWEKFTSSYCNYEVWEGNHFFIYDHVEKLVKIIETPLKKATD